MIKKLSRWFLPSLLVVLGILALASPVFASIPQPTALEIDEITAFENVREDGDQLYLVKYYIAINSTYDAEDLFIFRLLDEDDDELSSRLPYPYSNNGYGYGVVAFYLDGDDAPTWQSGVSVQIIGNPLADWDGDPLTASSSIITWNTGTIPEMQEDCSAEILGLATDLEQSWDVALTTVSQGVTFLSDTGAAYFLRVVPYLNEVAPYVLGQYTFTPDYPEDSPADTDYATELEEGIFDTIFDLRPMARSLGISRGALTAAIYYGFVVALFVLLISKAGLKKGMMLLAWPVVIAGAFFGIPLIVTILGGFFCLISTSWLIYKGVT